MKERIQKLIDIYTTYVFGVNRDAGWHAPSQLECLQSASMAKRSGLKVKQLSASFSTSDERQPNDSSNDKMINEMKFIRAQHHDFKLASLLFSYLKDKQLVALLAETYYQSIYKKVFTEVEIAKKLNTKPYSYRYSKKIAVNQIEERLNLIDQYEMVKTISIAV